MIQKFRVCGRDQGFPIALDLRHEYNIFFVLTRPAGEICI